MNQLSDKPGVFTGYQEAWIFAGLLFWLGIADTLYQPPYTWGRYFTSLFVLAMVLLPVLLFAIYKNRLKQTLPRRKYLRYWVACFCIYLPAITYTCVLWPPPGIHPGILFTGFCCCLLLELLLIANAYYQKRVRHTRWLQKLGLEKAILISIIILSLALGAMAVSSMDNPAYHTEHLLIGFEFSFSKIISKFGTFLSFSMQFMLIYLCGYLFFYINSNFLVSKVLKQRGLLLYILSGLATIAFFYPIAAQLIIALPINLILGKVFTDSPFQLEAAMIAVAIILLSLPVVLALQWSKQNNQIALLEKEKAQTELDLLKQQLNPHFFFNTLNNLYALSLQQSEKTPETILQLSELMRYVIYKGQETRVDIGLEVKYVEDYIQLQQIRLRKKLDLDFRQEISDDHIVIAPLLLIVFVENAFKHGIEPAEGNAFLHLYIKGDARQLYFSCENSFEAYDQKVAGIGLNNLQRRLTLLYPGRHVLKTGIKNHTFKAELQLDLS